MEWDFAEDKETSNMILYAQWLLSISNDYDKNFNDGELTGVVILIQSTGVKFLTDENLDDLNSEIRKFIEIFSSGDKIVINTAYAGLIVNRLDVYARYESYETIVKISIYVENDRITRIFADYHLIE